MASTIFYSWQSDLPNNVNRGFIEDALEKAIKQLNRDFVVDESPRDGDLELDQDTQGVPGSPPIVQVIFDKITRAAVFVPDVTFVGTTRDGERLLSNPNVLIEYGWALRELGHSKIVSVMNIAFGRPGWDTLPFDMRHLRWPITYSLASEAPVEERAKAKEHLVASFCEALRPVITRGLASSKSTPDAFSHATPTTWGPSVFWDLHEPFSRVVSQDGTTVPLNVMDVEHIFLRLIPAIPIGPLNPTDAVSLIRSGLHPMTDQNSGGRFGRNRYGAFVYAEANGKILQVTELLKTGELWGIDAYCIERKVHMEFSGVKFGYIPCSAFERVFVATLTNYLQFAEGVLKLSLPMKFIAGATRVQGYRMAVPPSLFGTKFDGDVVEANIVYSGTIDSFQQDPLRILRPFFDYVWRECGLQRPDLDVID